jgi:hypothetical protein
VGFLLFLAVFAAFLLRDQAIVRRKGYPSQSKTFESRANAEMWTRSVESKMDDNSFRGRREWVKLELHAALERYLASVTPIKWGQIQEHNGVLQPQQRPTAMRSMEIYLRIHRIRGRSNRGSVWTLKLVDS